jgi:hypothetical protein
VVFDDENSGGEEIPAGTVYRDTGVITYKDTQGNVNVM